MPRAGRRTSPSASSRRLPLLGLAVALAVVAALVAWQVLDGGSEDGYTPVSSFRDVHGLAVSPTDGRLLYVATHDGLVRGVSDGSWARVGSVRDDLMGFTMHPKDGNVFWSSGHALFEPNVGLRRSDDGGFSWRRLSLEGVDLHAIAVSPANPDNLWAWGGGRFWRSTDGGPTMTLLDGDAPHYAALAAHATDPETVYAAGPAGVVRSGDGGATWVTIAGPATAVAADPTAADVLHVATTAGVVTSRDDGATWGGATLTAPNVGYLAVDPSDGRVVYAATYATAIWKSEDGGATWRQVKAA